MQLEPDNFYHIYNRTNNEELLFKEEENYEYFLKQYYRHLNKYFETVAYCLMPTHFHFLVKILSPEQKSMRQSIATLLSAYTKAINKRFDRHGSLFQPRTKARLISDENYLLTVITYIHQNPVRAKLVQSLDHWPHSSYSQIIGSYSTCTVPVNKKYILEYFSNVENFIQYSRTMLEAIKEEYWISSKNEKNTVRQT